jgi:hypothetical protein
MSSTWSAGSRLRRFLPWTVGALAFLGLALAHAPSLTAQAKKGEKASKEAKDSKKDKEPKEEARPDPVIPKVVDVFASTRGGLEQVTTINAEIAKAWKANKVQPSNRCTDDEFIRRATLDIIGRIPTLAERAVYMKDSPQKRRSLLIDRLLDDPLYKNGELYAQNFANLWTILLMTRQGSGEAYREQMRDWLTRQLMGAKTSEKDAATHADWSKIAADLIAAQGKTNQNQAVNFVLTHMGEKVKGDPRENGAFDMVPVTSRTTKLFLGIRTQCVQCHDHPFNGEWNQEHFWGINAFFRQVSASERPTMLGKNKKGKDFVTQPIVRDDTGYNVKGIIPYERRNAVVLYTDPMFLTGQRIKKGSEHTRREELAHFITASPFFAKAFVNRMWGHFFGKSFTKDAVDDFGDHNPSSFPNVLDEDGKIKELGLLDRLADDWAKRYNHDPKMLIRWICNSQAYGLSSTANRFNDKPEDEVFFPRMLLKPMSPEQLFESILTATESKAAQNKEQLLTRKRAFLNKLIVNFGNDEGEEASYTGTVVQALLLMNGKEINEEINSKDGTVRSALVQSQSVAPAKREQSVLRYLYLTTLCREPTKHEINFIITRKDTRALPRDPRNDTWEAYWQDIMWALINSNEFILNH